MTWHDLQQLPLEIERIAGRPLELETASGWRRVTTVIELAGAGASGRGEDVNYRGEAQVELQAALAADVPSAPYRGTLGDWCERVAPVLLPALDEPGERRYRAWALESAAIDLALVQAGRTLGELLGGAPTAPLRFVVSGGLGAPPALTHLQRLRARLPGLEFKLDAAAAWSVDLADRIAEFGGVAIVDWKAAYETDFGQTRADLSVLRRVLEATAAIVEDPPLEREGWRALLLEHPGRVAWDAPLYGPAQVERDGLPAAHLNLKPSRIGSLAGTLELAELARAKGLGLYFGGQFELGPGRLQLQELARLLAPEGPNDASPVEFHAPQPEGLVGSPLPAPELQSGFGR